MAALSCLSISGAWTHTSAQLGHQRQWAYGLIQTQARRQSDALQHPSDSPAEASPVQLSWRKGLTRLLRHLDISLMSWKTISNTRRDTFFNCVMKLVKIQSQCLINSLFDLLHLHDHCLTWGSRFSSLYNSKTSCSLLLEKLWGFSTCLPCYTNTGRGVEAHVNVTQSRNHHRS